LLALLALFPHIAAADQTLTETGLLNGTAEINNRKMPYVVYVPRNYTPDTQLPVILFLHGAGASRRTSCGTRGASPVWW
jgi:predicted peptidase